MGMEAPKTSSLNAEHQRRADLIVANIMKGSSSPSTSTSYSAQSPQLHKTVLTSVLSTQDRPVLVGCRPTLSLLDLLPPPPPPPPLHLIPTVESVAEIAVFVSRSIRT